MNTFIVNHKRYTARAFDFNMMCDLEDEGYTLQDMVKKPLSMTRAYFAICAELEKEEAGKELEAHMVEGGTLEAVSKAMSKEMAESDFFQSLKKPEKTEAEQ